MTNTPDVEKCIVCTTKAFNDGLVGRKYDKHSPRVWICEDCNAEWSDKQLSKLATAIEEARKKGYDAGLADGTGKPLLAIEQIREQEKARLVKKYWPEIREYLTNSQPSTDYKPKAN